MQLILELLELSFGNRIGFCCGYHNVVTRSFEGLFAASVRNSIREQVVILGVRNVDSASQDESCCSSSVALSADAIRTCANRIAVAVESSCATLSASIGFRYERGFGVNDSGLWIDIRILRELLD